MSQASGPPRLRARTERKEQAMRIFVAGASAALAVGARKFVAQSYAGWTLAREGAAVKGEDAPLDPAPASNAKEAIAAIRYLEERVVAAKELDGIVLRYGGFYGPGTSFGMDG